MKILQANSTNARKQPHMQKIFQHENPKLCGVAAYHRQVQWLGLSAKASAVARAQLLGVFCFPLIL